jgi:hypothetical protein
MWACVLVPVGAAAMFLVLNIATLLAILAMNRRAQSCSTSEAMPPPRRRKAGALDASSILGWEYGYAQTTASEAMRDRHTMINFYLLTAGIVASGLLAALRGESATPKVVGTAFLWLLCCIGWFFFLKLIRLRQAWHESARVMNEIKNFYISHSKQFFPDGLRQAFLWGSDTLPAPDKPWTLFFYSSMLVAFVDSVAFVAGGLLLSLSAPQICFVFIVGGLVALGLAFLAFHAWMYFALLKC